MFTKQHFEACANAVRKLANESERSQLANLFAATFAEDNPAFNRAKFFAACQATDYQAALTEAAKPFIVDEIGTMSGGRVIVTGKSFRLLNVGQAFRFLAEVNGTLADDGKTRLAWQGARGPWVKVGARSYRTIVNGFAQGPTFIVGSVNTLCTVEPPAE